MKNREARHKKLSSSECQPKVFLKTYGCQMNEYDSELIRAILTEAGFRLTDDACEADVILLNTCSVRENAVRKIRGHIHQIRHHRQGRPAVYGILGCVATHLKEDILNDRHLNIDLTAGPDSYKRLPELISQCRDAKFCVPTKAYEFCVPTKAYDITLSTDETYEDIYPLRDSAANAWVAIMRGCNNFCSYCVVPYTRGRERSRSASGIVSEVRRLVREGFSQVTLLGQNVNSYSHDGVDFPKLLSMVSAVKGLKRIWFTSPHPKDFPDRLIDLIASDPKICKHIHLPLQSGSSAILKKMNRPYTKTQYLALVKKIRSRCPQIALTTDIIVGFPGETDQDFQDTVDVFQKTGYDSAFIFKYSPRQGTAAARLLDDVSEDAKTSRIVLLNALQKETALIKNQAFTGTTQEIMIDAVRENDIEGRTIHNKRVIIKRTGEPESRRAGEQEIRRAGEPESRSAQGGSRLLLHSGALALGTLINVSITGATPHLLRGEAA